MSSAGLSRSVRLVALLSALAACGCSTAVFRPAQDASFEVEPAREITDEDVRKAFAAKPQLPKRVRVAYYVFDEEYAEPIETMLRTVPAVASSYRIPTLLGTGKRRFDEPAYGPAPPSPPLSIKKLRLMAARARADVLVIFDYGHRISYSPNGLVAFGVALVPVLFLPVQDVEVKSYLDTYVFDTRNGYLYGQVTADRDAEDDFLFIYSDRGSELADGMRDELVVEAGRLLAKLLTEQVGPADATKQAAGPAPEPAPPVARELRLAFGPNGELYINGQPVESDADARKRLAELIGSEPPRDATIHAHSGIPHSRVMQIIDLLRELNVTSVGIQAGPPVTPGTALPPPQPSPPDAPPKRPALPNPASGEPSRVTPPPTFPPHGSPQPVSPSPFDHR
jgi:biopolymer transport protein ExbD